jgi:hypothetical protein
VTTKPNLGFDLDENQGFYMVFPWNSSFPVNVPLIQSTILFKFHVKYHNSFIWKKKQLLLYNNMPKPIGSMYGIYANIWGILMVNVTPYIYIYHTWILWEINSKWWISLENNQSPLHRSTARYGPSRGIWCWDELKDESQSPSSK